MIDQAFIKDVACWKQHYGLRSVGTTSDGKNVISGLDVFKLTSSIGVDLEIVLISLDQHGSVVDWLTYVKAATVEGWLIMTVLRKLQYPITEVYGERHWKEVETRIKLWFIEHMKHAV